MFSPLAFVAPNFSSGYSYLDTIRLKATRAYLSWWQFQSLGQELWFPEPEITPLHWIHNIQAIGSNCGFFIENIILLSMATHFSMVLWGQLPSFLDVCVELICQNDNLLKLKEVKSWFSYRFIVLVPVRSCKQKGFWNHGTSQILPYSVIFRDLTWNPCGFLTDWWMMPWRDEFLLCS